jgi:hypothetical protein
MTLGKNRCACCGTVDLETPLGQGFWNAGFDNCGTRRRQPVYWSDLGSDFHRWNELHLLRDRDTRPGLKESDIMKKRERVGLRIKLVHVTNLQATEHFAFLLPSSRRFTRRR